VDVVPVRRDGTGRLVAVGLIKVVDADGDDRWTTIGGTELVGETIDEAMERCIRETLGPDAHCQRSKPRLVAITGIIRPMGQRPAAGRRTDRAGINEPCAVEVWGNLVPQGLAPRFAWFLVTALPARHDFATGMRARLADFLEAQGEPGLAARLRQF
jgi:hypothetical protein